MGNVAVLLMLMILLSCNTPATKTWVLYVLKELLIRTCTTSLLRPVKNNAGKCQVINVTSKHFIPSIQLEISGQHRKWSETVNYFVVLIDRRSTRNAHMHQRVDRAETKMHSLYPFIICRTKPK